MKKLKPCKKCGCLPDYKWGKQPIFNDEGEVCDHYTAFKIVCSSDCEDYKGNIIGVHAKTEEAAITLWNKLNRECPYYVDMLINFSNDLSNQIKHYPDKVNLEFAYKVRRDWRKLINVMFADWGFSHKAIQTIQQWGGGGHNWELLHWDDKKDPTEIISDFASEVMYCSDRMGFDRFARCHYLINWACSNCKVKEDSTKK